MTLIEAYRDIAEKLAKLNPSIVANLKAPEEINEQVSTLLKKKKEGSINKNEAIELEKFLALDLLINLAKAKAEKLLS